MHFSEQLMMYFIIDITTFMLHNHARQRKCPEGFVSLHPFHKFESIAIKLSNIRGKIMASHHSQFYMMSIYQSRGKCCNTTFFHKLRHFCGYYAIGEKQWISFGANQLNRKKTSCNRHRTQLPVTPEAAVLKSCCLDKAREDPHYFVW